MHPDTSLSTLEPELDFNCAGQFARVVNGVRVALSHRVPAGAGLRPVMARHWYTGSVAVGRGRLLVSSGGHVIMDIHRPLLNADGHALSLELPTPVCLELTVDADRCTDNLHGFWGLRLFTPQAETLALVLGG